MSFETISTPEDNFDNLKDYDFKPNFTRIMGYNIHFVDEGGKDDPMVLLLHGEPSWSYLYRHMIPLLVNEGFRVIAPDLLGFGKSDKLIKRSNYSYQLLVDILTEFVEYIDSKIEVMFMQDWGSLIGFRLMETVGNRISRILLSNGGFPTKSGITSYFGHFIFKMMIKFGGQMTLEDLRANPNFPNWVKYSQSVETLPVGEIIQWASNSTLDPDEIDAYNAPFPDKSYKEGARQLPILVPSQLRKNQQVWNDVIKTWQKPFLTIFGDNDPITAGGEKKIIAKVPGAKGLNHRIVSAGHFIQEDQPQKLVSGIKELFEVN